MAGEREKNGERQEERRRSRGKGEEEEEEEDDTTTRMTRGRVAAGSLTGVFHQRRRSL